MPDYRTPKEWREKDQRDARIRRVLDQTVADAASCKAAIALSEPQQVVELWVNRIWNRLRIELDPEDRIAAIVLLLENQANDSFRAVMRSITEVGDGRA